MKYKIFIFLFQERKNFSFEEVVKKALILLFNELLKLFIRIYIYHIFLPPLLAINSYPFFLQYSDLEINSAYTRDQ